MSYLDYLNKDEWKKLGLITFISFSTLFTFSMILYFLPGDKVAGAFFIGLKVSALYSIIYTIVSFLFLYFKGKKTFKSLLIFNFIVPILYAIYLLLLLGFGPHG